MNGRPANRRRRWTRTLPLAVVIGAVVFVLVPVTLRWIADPLAGRAREALRACEDGTGDAAWADRLLAIRGGFPGFGDDSAALRRRAIAGAARALEACVLADIPPPGLTGEVAELLVERGPGALADARGAPVRDVYRALHAVGRDRAVVRLAGALGPAGATREIVRAHLYLGDVDGAADLATAPGARVDPRGADVPLLPAAALCMAGRPGDALAAFERLRAPIVGPPRLAAGRRAAIGAAHAECAIRAGRLDVLETLLPRLDADARDASAVGPAYYRAALAEARGDPRRALAIARRAQRGTTDARDLALAVYEMALLARQGRPLEVLAASRRPAVRQQVSLIEDTSAYGGSLFNPIWYPILHERHIEEAARALAEGPVTGRAAAELYAIWAVRLGRRWDPRAGDVLDRARELAPGWEAAEDLRAQLAFVHGDYEPVLAREGRFPDRLVAAARRLSSGGEGELEPMEPMEPAELAAAVALGGLDPANVTGHEAIARLIATDRPPQQIVDVLRLQLQEAPVTSLYFRLTNLVVVGRRLGIDVARYERRLAGLREAVDRQPNALVFADRDHAQL